MLFFLVPVTLATPWFLICRVSCSQGLALGGCQTCLSSNHGKAKSLMANAFFQSGVELFHPQRWHMCTPSLREWSALSLMHSIGATALEMSGQLAEAARVSEFSKFRGYSLDQSDWED